MADKIGRRVMTKITAILPLESLRKRRISDVTRLKNRGSDILNQILCGFGSTQDHTGESFAKLYAYPYNCNADRNYCLINPIVRARAQRPFSNGEAYSTQLNQALGPNLIWRQLRRTFAAGLGALDQFNDAPG